MSQINIYHLIKFVVVFWFSISMLGEFVRVLVLWRWLVYKKVQVTFSITKRLWYIDQLYDEWSINQGMLPNRKLLLVRTIFKTSVVLSSIALILVSR